MEVTDEKIHDGNEMKAFVDRVMKRNNNKNYKIKTVLVYVVYGSNKNVKYLNEKRFYRESGYEKTLSHPPPKKNNKIRNRKVRSQTKEISPYGKRKGNMEIPGWLKKRYFHL